MSNDKEWKLFTNPDAVFVTDINQIWTFNPYGPQERKKNITPKHTKTFHKKKHLIDDVISQVMDPHEVVHGEQAIQKQLPKYLHRGTVDWDVFTPTPKKDAEELEQALDKKFGGDFFYVKPGQHPGTWKVIAYANQEGYADYTKPDNDIPFVVIHGKKYSTLKYSQKKAKAILKDPASKFRHHKDKDTVNRITIAKKSRRNVF